MKSLHRTHIILVICAFLLAYLGFILFVNFKTEIQRNKLLSDLFATEASHIRRQMDLLLTTYFQMLENLSSDRLVTSYFINKRMGMSDAYGLLISKMEVMRLLNERSCDEGSNRLCFSVLKLMDNNKEVLFGAGKTELNKDIPGEFLGNGAVFPIPSEGMLCAARTVAVESYREGYLVGCLTDRLILGEFERYVGKESKLVQVVSFRWQNVNDRLVFRYNDESGWNWFWYPEGHEYRLDFSDSQILSFNLRDGIIKLDVYSQPLPVGIQNVTAYLLGIFALISLGIIVLNWQRIVNQLADLNSKLTQKAKEAEEASQAKTKYVSYISHEIRTPLNYILGYAQIMLQDKWLTEDKKAFIQSIVQGCELIVNIINEVLDIARLESGAIDIKHEPFNLGDCFKELEETMRLGAMQKGVFLQFIHRSRSDKDPVLIGDKLKLQQVIMNFLSNAIKLTPEGKEVVVESIVEELGEDKAKLIVEICDSGPGLSPEEKEKIFLPFYQTEPGIRAGGTGLGMYFAHKLVELMGGKIEVQSEVGKGTSVKFSLIMDTLPSEKTQEVDSEESRPYSTRSFPPLRVLICDDDSGTRSVLRLWCETMGCIVEEADSGKYLLEKVSKFKPDVAFIDMVLPDMDGINCIRKIRNIEKERPIKVIAITGKTYENYETKAIEEGADCFLLKPMRLDEISNVIHALCSDGDVASRELTVARETDQIPQDLLQELKHLIQKADLQSFIRKVEKSSTALGKTFSRSLLELAQDYKYQEILELLDKTHGRGEH